MSAAGDNRPAPARFDQQRLIVNQPIGLGAVFVQEEGVWDILVLISPRDGTGHYQPRSDLGGPRRFDKLSRPRSQCSLRCWRHTDEPMRRGLLAIVLRAQCCGMNIDPAVKSSAYRHRNAPGVIVVAVTDD